MRKSDLNLSLILMSTLFGCGALEDALNPREQDTREKLTLQALPGDPTNAVADDARAARLGQALFFETRLSGPLGPENDGIHDGSLGIAGETEKVACASCHDPKNGGSDHRSIPGATSLAAGYTGRNASAVLNAAYSPIWQFWDGRKDSLWSQALGPLESAVEQNTTRLDIAHVVAENYSAQYSEVFGALPDLSDSTRFPVSGKPGSAAFDSMAVEDQRTINRIYANVGKSIAAYERRLECKNSPFDRWSAGDENAMSDLAVRGYKLFVGEAGCLECHRGGTFTDYRFHNIGVPRTVAEDSPADEGRMVGISTVKSDVFNRAGEYSDSVETSHLSTLEAAPDTEGQFKTPSLRCVELTAPYMHNGAYKDLWEVVNHYRFGGATGAFAGTKDPAIRPLALEDNDLEALVEFLKSLTGEALPEELVTQPVE